VPDAGRRNRPTEAWINGAVCSDVPCQAPDARLTGIPGCRARAMRRTIRVHAGSNRAEPSQACQVGRPSTTNGRSVCCVTVAGVSKIERKSPAPSSGWQRPASESRISRLGRPTSRLLQQNRPIATICIAAKTSYSITSSASNCIEIGTSMPSAFAVLRLITNSNLVGWSTGKLAGFSPFKTRPV
jgi:hypothetical protein